MTLSSFTLFQQVQRRLNQFHKIIAMQCLCNLKGSSLKTNLYSAIFNIRLNYLRFFYTFHRKYQNSFLSINKTSLSEFIFIYRLIVLKQLLTVCKHNNCKYWQSTSQIKCQLFYWQNIFKFSVTIQVDFLLKQENII